MKRIEIVVPTPRDTELAWAAGFIDGEGCFDANIKVNYQTSKGEKKRRYLRLSVDQQNRELLDQLVRIFGLGKVYSYKGRPGSPAGHKWVCNGRVAFYVAGQVWPYLGEQKKGDFKRAIRRMLETRREWVAKPYRGPRIIQGGVSP